MFDKSKRNLTFTKPYQALVLHSQESLNPYFDASPNLKFVWVSIHNSVCVVAVVVATQAGLSTTG